MLHCLLKYIRIFKRIIRRVVLTFREQCERVAGVGHAGLRVGGEIHLVLRPALQGGEAESAVFGGDVHAVPRTLGPGTVVHHVVWNRRETVESLHWRNCQLK